MANKKRTDNTMANKNRTKRLTMVDKTLHRNLNIKQNESQQKQEVNSGSTKSLSNAICN